MTKVKSDKSFIIVAKIDHNNIAGRQFFDYVSFSQFFVV